MGYLTTFTIYNDGASGILKDPKQFADKIDSLIGTRQYEEFHTTTGVNGFVQQSLHADEMTIYINAGNCVTEVNPYSRSFKDLIKKNPEFARELLEFVDSEVVKLKKVLLEEMSSENLTSEEKNIITKNPNTPPETLDRLANDEEILVRWNVAQNPNTPPETLERLSYDKIYYVRYNVAYNPNTPPETLERLSTDEDSDVRYWVACNPNTTPETLDRLANDNNSWVRYWVAANLNTPPETLDRLSTDEDSSVRYNVAYNPNTQLKTLKRLAADNNEGVRQSAHYNINKKLDL